jgi:hypothetical protein
MGALETAHLFAALVGGSRGWLRDRLRERHVSPDRLEAARCAPSRRSEARRLARRRSAARPTRGRCSSRRRSSPAARHVR